MYLSFFKRAIDLIISITGIILLWPLFLIIGLLIKCESEGPIFFNQERIGKNGKVFKIHKFRSMYVNAEKLGVYSNNKDKRVTKIGRILRMTSLDEIPQLLNMFVGDMSLIGPRPPLTYHPWTFDEYTEEQKHMFDVRPGLTGWAQIHGRKDVEWNKRIELNVWYANNVSFLLDLKIFFITIIKVISNADNENVQKTVVLDEKAQETDRDVLLK